MPEDFKYEVAMGAAWEILNLLDGRPEAATPERLGMVVFTVLDAIYRSEGGKAAEKAALSPPASEMQAVGESPSLQVHHELGDDTRSCRARCVAWDVLHAMEACQGKPVAIRRDAVAVAILATLGEQHERLRQSLLWPSDNLTRPAATPAAEE